MGGGMLLSVVWVAVNIPTMQSLASIDLPLPCSRTITLRPATGYRAYAAFASEGHALSNDATAREVDIEVYRVDKRRVDVPLRRSSSIWNTGSAHKYGYGVPFAEFDTTVGGTYKVEATYLSQNPPEGLRGIFITPRERLRHFFIIAAGSGLIAVVSVAIAAVVVLRKPVGQ